MSNNIERALKALPNATGGEWWVDDRGELLSDPVGSVKIAKFVDGANPEQREANKTILAAARELAEEVVRLRRVNSDPEYCLDRAEEAAMGEDL